jgi:L,D-transpeptidase YcbB
MLMQTITTRFGTLQLLNAVLLAAIMTGSPVGARPNDHANDLHGAEPFVETGVSVSAFDIRDYVVSRTHTTLDSDVQKFYADRKFRPVWMGNGANDEMAASVLLALGHAYQQGLRQQDYDTDLAHWKKLTSSGAERDVGLTRALFHYAHDVRLGRARPDQVYRDVRLPSQYFDAGPPLADALKHQTIDGFLADLPPPQPEYRALQIALAHYQSINAQGGWPVVPGSGAIVPGSKDARLKVLARRLAYEDPVLAGNPNSDADDLRQAIVRFQTRNGLAPTGKAGADTLNALNVPVAVRIRQITLNMERWRWMPRTLEKSYVRVNVTDQSLDFIKDGDIALHSRVIIGTKATPTPILRTEVQSIVANPPWNIPGDLVAKKLLPRLKKDPGYLATRGMTLVDGPADDPHGKSVNWKELDGAKLPAVQQSPGSDNALGAVMLDMPNDFDVYLHDTPNKKLFEQDTRELSNGCVRVEQIQALASLVLTGDADKGQDKLSDAIDSHETQTLTLDNPVPVYMEYWTAIADADGTTGFYPDRYGRDPVLQARLATPPPSMPVKSADIGQVR